MANLIKVNSQETLVKGSYQTEKYIYNVEYNYADGKATRIAISILDAITNMYIGNATYTESNTNVNVNLPSVVS